MDFFPARHWIEPDEAAFCVVALPGIPLAGHMEQSVLHAGMEEGSGGAAKRARRAILAADMRGFFGNRHGGFQFQIPGRVPMKELGAIRRALSQRNIVGPVKNGCVRMANPGPVLFIPHKVLQVAQAAVAGYRLA